MSRRNTQRILSTVLLMSAALSFTAPGVGCEQVIGTPQRLGHAEVRPNLNGIRAAQIAHRAVHGSYVEVTEPVPRTADQLDTKTIPWPQGTNFDKLDWAPASSVAGIYWIELTNGGEGFIAHGLIDADGDGVPAHYTAARDEEAKAITSEGIF
jgi:hypothetical protein